VWIPFIHRRKQRKESVVGRMVREFVSAIT
jgi:hypothetical protein